MVRGSGIRERLRSDVLKELARERGMKQSKEDSTSASLKRKREEEGEEDDDYNYDINLAINKQDQDKSSISNNNLLSILPKPKNSSSFGPTLRIDKLLQLQERADDALNAASINAIGRSDINPAERIGEDGIMEIDVSKVVGEIDTSTIKELTVEKTNSSNVIVPGGKEKQKNQLTYLVQLSKATELERKEKDAQGRLNKAAARSKYGW